MKPRTSARILTLMDYLKRRYDRRYFVGKPLSREYKLTLAASWQTLNRQLVPLLHELEAARRYESRMRITRMLQVAARPAWFEHEYR